MTYVMRHRWTGVWNSVNVSNSQLKRNGSRERPLFTGWSEVLWGTPSVHWLVGGDLAGVNEGGSSYSRPSTVGKRNLVEVRRQAEPGYRALGYLLLFFYKQYFLFLFFMIVLLKCIWNGFPINTLSFGSSEFERLLFSGPTPIVDLNVCYFPCVLQTTRQPGGHAQWPRLLGAQRGLLPWPLPLCLQVRHQSFTGTTFLCVSVFIHSSVFWNAFLVCVQLVG